MHPAGVAPATPLTDVTFVVLDLETTGPAPEGCAITEVGALKYRAGECLATFQTLVNPGVRLPPDIVYLTGITEAMVAPAPMIESVLPAFAEFIGDAVVVGHNVRFDLGFLRANLARLGYPSLPNASVDTLALARRLVADEVEDCKLATLARHFRTAADPCHRAFDDAAATAEVFHHLLEQVGSIGVTALDDLLALPVTAGHPQVQKLRWVASLPRSPGVYLFRDGAGAVIYVGRAGDLRRRVRSYFGGVERRRTRPLLREAQSLEHVACATDLEAAVVESRLLHAHLPRYNQATRAWRRQRFLRFREGDDAPPTVARVMRPRRGERYVGPFPTADAARAAVRDGAAAERVRARQERLESLARVGRLVVEVDGGDGVIVEGGRLVATSHRGIARPVPGPSPSPAEVTFPLPPDLRDEAAVVTRWLEVNAHRARVVEAEPGWAVRWEPAGADARQEGPAIAVA